MAYRETVNMRARKDAQRQGLLQAAEGLVREQGFASLTIQQVARRAGVGIGTVYRYFDNKDALVCEIFRIASGREVEALRVYLTGDRPASERLAQGCRLFAERAMKAPRLAWALIAEPVDAALDDERLRYRAAYADVFEQVLIEGMNKGEFVPQDARLTAAALVGGIAEAMLGPLAAPEMDSEMINALCDWCLRAVGSGEMK